MAHENIEFDDPHFTSSGEYFYKFDDTYDALFAKLQDGRTAFSYPLLTPLTRVITSAEYDGFYFWTLETPGTYDITIKKWRITEDYYCELVKQFDFVDDAGDRYVSSAFTLEHYVTAFNTTISGNSTYIDLANYADKVTPGDVITLGPNSNGEYEEVTATGTLTVSGTEIGLTFFTYYDYQAGDKICFNSNLWVFSDWAGVVDDGNGALYKINPDTGEVKDRYDSNIYKNVTAATFATIWSAKHVGIRDVLFYIKSNTLSFLNTEDLSYYTTMLIDNLKANGSTVIPVLDLVVTNETVYRLQQSARYPHTTTGADTDYSWSTYNYVLSPIRNYIDSFVLGAYPAILPANAVNQTAVTATVKDQYGLDISFKPTYFYDDDTVGFMQYLIAYTDSNGIATNWYRSGIEPREVTLAATISQDD